MSTVELLFSDRRHPGPSQPHAWANSEVASISLEIVRVIHSLILRSFAAASTDTLRCRSGPQAKIELAGEPAARLNAVLLATSPGSHQWIRILPLQAIHVGGLDVTIGYGAALMTSPCSIPTESSYSTLAMYPLYSIMVAPLPQLEIWLLPAPSPDRLRVEDEVCENLPDTSSR